MKTARFLSLFGAIVLSLLFIHQVSASSILQNFKASLSDPRPAVSANHTFTFTTSSGGDYANITVTYCKEPTWGGACTVPTGLNLGNLTGGSLVTQTGLDGNWTLDYANVGSNYYKILYPTADGGKQTFGSGDQKLILTVNAITNPAIAGCNSNGVNASTGTCYVKIGIYDGADTASDTLIDSGVTSITMVAQVTVTARVDPSFTFVVNGVDESTENNGVTTSVSSAYNTLPFGALTAGTPKYAAHQLTVTTNSQAGYTVSIKMATQMTGLYTANNIDPFQNDGNHSAWAEPDGTVANTDTGWIGYNTSDNDVTNWTVGDSAEFAGVSSSAESLVMKATTSDNGSVSDYVSYAIEANVYQPADIYTGILYYNALPTY